MSVKNTGDVAVDGSFAVTIGISQVGYPGTTNRTLSSTGPLAPGATKTGLAPFCIDFNEIEGADFTVVVVADSSSQVAESDETDNRPSVVFSAGVASYP